MLTRTLALVVVCLSLSYTALAQEGKCVTKLGQAPELWGFKLGMTFDEVKTRYANLHADVIDSWGVLRASVDPHENMRVQRNYEWMLSGVKSVGLRFSDGRLIQIDVLYDFDTGWARFDQITTDFARRYQLPNSWQPFEGSDDARQLVCDGFEVLALPSPIAGIGLYDTEVVKALNARRPGYKR